MWEDFSYARFRKLFPNDDVCLEEIKKIKHDGGIYCRRCRRLTRHYKLKKRPVYSCKFCRSQTSPLKDTIFEKTTTPLSYWFFTLFLMTQLRADIKIKTLQRELGVTYKTAWRMYRLIYKLMERNNGDLLSDEQVRRWTFFNKLELRVVRKSSY